MSELIATLVTKGSYFQRMPRINLNAVEDLLLIKPKIVHAAFIPEAPPLCVPFVRANKCCQVNVDYAADLAHSLFAHGQMTRAITHYGF